VVPDGPLAPYDRRWAAAHRTPSPVTRYGRAIAALRGTGANKSG